MGETLPRLLGDARRAYVPGLPKVLFWAIINRCNAVCTTCGFYLVPRAREVSVSLDRARRALDILYDGGFRFTSITGGEPLMNPDALDICDAVTRRGIAITYIPTNGTLVDDAVARRLRDADVKVVGVSVEVPGPDGMGATRKIPRLRDVAVRAREALDRAGVANYAGVLVSRATLDIRAVFEYVAGCGFDKIVFSYPQLEQGSSYAASRPIPELALTAEEVGGIVRDIKAAKREYPEIGVYNTDASLDDFARFYRGEPRRFPCWGGRRLFYLDWDLDLYRCFTLPTRYGNLLEMGRVEAEEDGLCDLCTQQAFRDFGPFYAGAGALDRAYSLLKGGHPVGAMRAAAARGSLGGLRALLEVYGAGFL